MSLDKAKMASLVGADKKKFAIAAAKFNPELVDAMAKDVYATLTANGVLPENIAFVRVPGSAELPYAAAKFIEETECDAVITLGVVIAGETPHHMIIAHSTASALQTLATERGICVINGIIVTNNREQAEARTIGSIRRGIEFAESALEMVCSFQNNFDSQNFKFDL